MKINCQNIDKIMDIVKQGIKVSLVSGQFRVFQTLQEWSRRPLMITLIINAMLEEILSEQAFSFKSV